MKKYIIPILTTIPLFFPICLLTSIGLLLGYMILIILLLPLEALFEMGGMWLPFHTVSNKLYVPWKALLIIASCITIVILIKKVREKIR